jgi:acetylornithine/N-succinyldiaminopimelate aminotransferase
MSVLADRHVAAVMNTFGRPRRALVRGEGCAVWDEDGHRYLDLLGGIAVNALGHAHPAIVEAVSRQVATLGHVSNFFASRPQVELAERLVDLLGAPGKVFFTNSGAEANEAALKMTRLTGRTQLVAATGSFHGRTMGALALTSKQAYRAPFEPLPGDVTFVPYGDAAALEAAVTADTAAVVLEPVQGEAGVVLPPAGYLQAARSVTARHGALLWLDEVQTGMGRTGEWFAHQHDKDPIRADIVTLAKGLGGGVPIGACVGLDSAAGLLSPGQHGTTFGGNPLAAAAALATIEVIDTEQLLAAVELAGTHLTDAVRALGHPAIAGVRGRGLLTATLLRREIATPASWAALDAGFIVNDCTPTVLRTAPPLIVTPVELDTWVEALPTVLDKAAAAVGEIA